MICEVDNIDLLARWARANADREPRRRSDVCDAQQRRRASFNVLSTVGIQGGLAFKVEKTTKHQTADAINHV